MNCLLRRAEAIAFSRGPRSFPMRPCSSNNAAAVFNDPIQAHTGLVLLTHQLGYFNMRPLYVVLIVRSLDLNPPSGGKRL
jgi:hypothetical protein